MRSTEVHETPRLKFDLPEPDVEVQVIKKDRKPTFAVALEAIMRDAPEDVKRQTPMYYVVAEAGFFDRNGILHILGSKIYHKGQPNEGLEPMNEAARLRVLAWEATMERGRMSLDDVVYEAMRNRPRDGELEEGDTVAVEKPFNRRDVSGTTNPKTRVLSDETMQAEEEEPEATTARNSPASRRARRARVGAGGADTMPEDP